MQGTDTVTESQEPSTAQSVTLQNQPGQVSVFERIADYWWVPIAAGLLVFVVSLVGAFIKRSRRG